MNRDQLAAWDTHLRTRADLMSCCKHSYNLVMIEETAMGTALRACTVCGRRHRYMFAEPGYLGLKPN
jgi:hypothetical protein